jgi:CMP-N,N'-diacetyllegionaminic acid synthase|tara:strand:- start:4088 stop:4801 length:714 start_codon:yes stop_codon:yes gene_type:complete
MNILCTIAAREGSKGVPGKNKRKLNGKPLIQYSIEQAQKSGIFKHIIVSTDSKEIAVIAKNCGIETWFLRPSELSTDKVGKYPVIKHALYEAEDYFNIKYDNIVDLDVTTPMRNTDDIQLAYQQFHHEDTDLLISVTLAKKNPYFNMVEVEGSKKVKIVKEKGSWPARRQDAPIVYNINASIYIWKRNYFLANCDNFLSMLKGRVSLYDMPEERAIDIDSEFDYRIIELLMREKSGN